MGGSFAFKKGESQGGFGEIPLLREKLGESTIGIELYGRSWSNWRRGSLQRTGGLGDEPGHLGLYGLVRVLRISKMAREGGSYWGRARLRFMGIRSSRRRVLRLMGESDFPATRSKDNPHGPRAHGGGSPLGRVGIHGAKYAARFEALEPIPQALRGCGSESQGAS